MGAIVNCSSIGGLVGGAKRASYRAAKYGVIGLTTSAALEYGAQGIRINAMCPGLFDTPMSDRMKAAGQTAALEAMMKDVPIGRVGRPEEIVSAALFLCSSAASMVAGHSLVVDGGYTIHEDGRAQALVRSLASRARTNESAGSGGAIVLTMLGRALESAGGNEDEGIARLQSTLDR